ncbi:MAG: hypothetical protein SOY64_10055 [Pyramidobacter sp.]|uniref:HD domain-containing protein n=1 Tax=Pyramidobacter sp. TaxID=1943581 RepID=UPI002A7EF25E|nr:HD domain-containing protein [Pyramidobacter sp.]MDY4033382.1 hypothetical protein [Pyramidobacter sp.]
MNRIAMSRKNFLELAAGSAVGAALFRFPALGLASEPQKASRSLKAVGLADLPGAIDAAKASSLVDRSFKNIVECVERIGNEPLRRETLKLVKDPTLTFLEQYTSPASVEKLYAALAAEKLVDPAKVDAAHLLPPMDKPVQAFMTAPGSGYGSHHSYPGGLATHVDVNLHITETLCRIYDEVYMYEADRDVAVAAQALHDIAKPYVFQWQPDGSSLKEYPVAGQGAHHVISLAEVIWRNFPAEEVIAQACAHGAPSSPKEEEAVCGWLKAAALMAGKDPVKYGLLAPSGKSFPGPHRQEGYIVHLGDHDWVLSVPAAQKAVKTLRRIAGEMYGMSEADLNGAKFNAFRNYVGAQTSYMFLNALEGREDGYALAAAEVAAIILK